MNVADSSGWRVLVLEDDGFIAMYISDLLEELGHLVVGPVRSVSDALAAIEKDAVDAALLDVNLGDGETSFPVAEILNLRAVPFAFLTGYGEIGVNGRFPGRPVISKPVEETNLLRMLEELRAS